MDNKVTVMMIVYNGEEYIYESLQSALNQTVENFKMVIVDDGSTDNTYAILDKFVKNEERATLIRHSENMGRPISRNHALEHVDTEYVAILDADDIALPMRLQRQLEYISLHPEADIVGCGTEFIDENGNPTGARWIPEDNPQKIWNAMITFGPAFAHSSALFRSDALRKIGGYRPQFVLSQDCDLYLRLGNSTNCAAIPDVLVQYRLHDRNSSPERRMYQARLHIIALASWMARYAGAEDPVDALKAPISAELAEKLAPEFLEKSGRRAKLAWIGILLNSPQWPDRSKALLDAWIDAASSLMNFSDSDFSDALVRSTMESVDDTEQISALIHTFQHPIREKIAALEARMRDYQEIFESKNRLCAELDSVYASKMWKAVCILRKIYHIFR
jgi:glycosyltransferase involved in cell wall biosynthesis